MFFVYPLESFVARHVIMTNLFRGRDAHEGDDHAVLDRWDRRVSTTIVLFLSVLIPALNFSDVGLVLAFTGTVAATSLTYLLPGLLFIGVHGEEFLDVTESRWGCTYQTDDFTTFDCITWYLLLMPCWCRVARMGKRCLAFHIEKKALQTPAQTFRLGKVKHKCSPLKHMISYGSLPSCTEEEDPQEEKQRAADFILAVGFVAFGVIALLSGMLSIVWSVTGYE